MQILDSFVDGMMLLPDERDRRDYAYGLVLLMRGEGLPEDIRPVPRAILASNLPAIEGSRARAQAGRSGGSKRQANHQANAKQTDKQTPSKREANGEANAKQTAEQDGSDGPESGEANAKRIGIGIGIEDQPTKGRCVGLPPRPCEEPSPDDVRTYLSASCLPAIDADRFCDHYASVGWRDPQGRPISDWRPLARKWGREDAEKRASSGEVSAGEWDAYAAALGA